jgi:hypothetical protein
MYEVALCTGRVAEQGLALWQGRGRSGCPLSRKVSPPLYGVTVGDSWARFVGLNNFHGSSLWKSRF